MQSQAGRGYQSESPLTWITSLSSHPSDSSRRSCPTQFTPRRTSYSPVHTNHPAWATLQTFQNVSKVHKSQTGSGRNPNTSGIQPHNHSLVPPSLAQAATNCRSLCSSYQVASGQTQEVADRGLHRSPSQEALGLTHLVAGFRPHKSNTQ